MHQTGLPGCICAVIALVCMMSARENSCIEHLLRAMGPYEGECLHGTLRLDRAFLRSGVLESTEPVRSCGPDRLRHRHLGQRS